MTRDELVEQLKMLAGIGDPECSHVDADELLLEYINDPEVSKAFFSIDKWYA